MVHYYYRHKLKILPKTYNDLQSTTSITYVSGEKLLPDSILEPPDLTILTSPHRGRDYPVLRGRSKSHNTLKVLARRLLERTSTDSHGVLTHITTPRPLITLPSHRTGYTDPPASI